MNLEKEILRLRIAIEKETNKDIKKILLQQKKYLEQLRKEIGDMYMKYSDNEGNLSMNISDKHSTMKKVEKELVDMRKVLATKTITIAGTTLLKSYVDSYYKTANIIDKGVSVNINYKILRPEFLEAVIGAKFENMTYSDRIWKNTDWLTSKLYDVIGRGITDGTKIQKLSKEIKDTFGSSSYQAHRLVQNEMARCVSNAQDQIYRDSNVINEIMFVATLDDRTSEICQNLDGTRYKLTDNYPKIPDDTHIMCRSCYIPVVEGWSPKQRRDNITKENIEYKSYSDWKKDNNIS